VGRGPEDKHTQVFFDVVESVLDTRRDKDETARFDWTIVLGDPDHPATADHVIDLVLFMWLLAVRRSREPNREADAELFRSEEIDVSMPVGVARLWIQLGNFMRFHSSDNYG
jgi:hypothetical protein